MTGLWDVLVSRLETRFYLHRRRAVTYTLLIAATLTAAITIPAIHAHRQRTEAVPLTVDYDARAQTLTFSCIDGYDVGSVRSSRELRAAAEGATDSEAYVKTPEIDEYTTSVELYVGAIPSGRDDSLLFEVRHTNGKADSLGRTGVLIECRLLNSGDEIMVDILCRGGANRVCYFGK